jgi:hypothetical protein
VRYGGLRKKRLRNAEVGSSILPPSTNNQLAPTAPFKTAKPPRRPVQNEGAAIGGKIFQPPRRQIQSPVAPVNALAASEKRPERAPGFELVGS